MAGNYPDVPDHRIPYHRDGTLGWWIREDSQGVIRRLDAAELVSLNNESDSGWLSWGDGNNNTPVWVGFIFPYLRSIAAYFVGYSVGQYYGNRGLTGVQYSANTTSGLDGTWNTLDASPVSSAPTASTSYNWRVAIRDVADQANVKGVRFGFPHLGSLALGGLESIHIYGAQQTPIRFWHPTNDAAIGGAYFDWGDIPQSSSAVLPFRLKNLDPEGRAAHGVTLGRETLVDSSPSSLSYFTFSSNGVDYSSSLNIGDIAYGAISGVLYVRRVIGATAQLGVFDQQFAAVPTSMS